MTENQFTSIIDFTEIKPAHKFEQFAADVLHSKGFEINIGPAEGPDGGMDMVVTDTLIGRVSTKPVKYLVSCKHLNRAVGTSDEKDIESRVRSHNCDAFMGFYSSHVTQGLNDKVYGLKSNPRQSLHFDVVLIQDTDIKRILYELDDGYRLVRQWFPLSYARFLRELSDSKVYDIPPEMRCSVCETSLLDRMSGSVVYDVRIGPAATPTGDFAKDQKYRPHIHDIRAYCPAHIPGERLADNSYLLSVQDMVEDPKQFLHRFAEDAKFMYLWPPYFASPDSFRRWNELVHVIFYFIARGRTRMKPAATSTDLRRLLPPMPDRWELKRGRGTDGN